LIYENINLLDPRFLQEVGDFVVINMKKYGSLPIFD